MGSINEIILARFVPLETMETEPSEVPGLHCFVCVFFFFSASVCLVLSWMCACLVAQTEQLHN